MDIFEKEIKKILSVAGVEGDLLIPPDPKMGDFAFPCFRLSTNPNSAAKELKQKIRLVGPIERAEVKGQYLNFFISKKALAEHVLSKSYKKEEKDEKVMIEFSQANTHKAFHVGHLRGTTLGESLSRILKKAGYRVVKANYQGDTGAHVAKWLWCYSSFHENEEPPAENAERWIAGIYVEAVKKLEENPDFQKSIDRINKALEDRSDQDLVNLWKKSRQWSLDALELIYKDLDVSFDHYFFEGEVEERGKEISEELVKRGIARVDNGATIVDLEADGLGVWVLLRKDGTSLYSSKDLALAEKKFTKFGINRSIYVVGAAQTMHFKQMFRTLELMNFLNLKRCEHLSFAEVRFPHGKMSSRTGDNVLYSDLKRNLLEYSQSEAKKRHPDWTEEEVKESAFAVSIAAMKFSMLSQDPKKSIVFDMEKSLDFEGETGPYVQYAHARICSILRKYGKDPGEIDYSLLKEDMDKALLLHLMRFWNTVSGVAESMRVNVLCSYALTLSQMWNEYYHKFKVISDDENLTISRIALAIKVKEVLAGCLELLGIHAPERM